MDAERDFEGVEQYDLILVLNIEGKHRTIQMRQSTATALHYSPECKNQQQITNARMHKTPNIFFKLLPLEILPLLSAQQTEIK